MVSLFGLPAANHLPDRRKRITSNRDRFKSTPETARFTLYRVENSTRNYSLCLSEP